MTNKDKADEYLMALLGRKDLVERWWTGQNKGFDMKTPQEIWDSGEEGQKTVLKYLIFFLTR